jgi:signal peptidase I
MVRGKWQSATVPTGPERPIEVFAVRVIAATCDAPHRRTRKRRPPVHRTHDRQWVSERVEDRDPSRAELGLKSPSGIIPWQPPGVAERYHEKRMNHDEPRVAAELRRPEGPSTSEPGVNGRPPLTPADAFFPPQPPDDLVAATDGQPAPAAPAKAGSGGRAVREIVETILLAVVIFVAVRLVVLNFRVDGMSMSPNLDNGEMLLVNRNVYFHFDMNAAVDWIPGVEREGEDIVYPFHPPERGDIIVFNPPLSSEKPYIKRVIGLPGERVEIKEGHVYIDGVQLQEPYIEGEITRCENRQASCDPVEVPEGHVYVLGDNRNNSSDSRSFGAVDVDSIIGKAWFAYWPSEDIGLVPHYDYPEIEDD